MERISELIMGFLLNAAWQIALIAIVAWACSRLLRSAPARYRHALWVAALILSFALPLWSLLGVAGDAPPLITQERIGPVPAQENLNAAPNSPPTRGEVTTTEKSGLALSQLLQRRRQPVVTAPSLPLVLALCYALFILYRLGTLGRSWRRTRSLRQSGYEREIPARMSAIAARCREALGLKGVPLVFSAKATTPVTVGATAPLIILPETFYATHSDETLVTVLGHEMAHVARRDYALNLACEILSLPISFHPLTKFIKRQIDRTRELACDDLVTERLLEPKAYARALVRVAGELVAPAGQAFTLGIFDADILEERIVKLTQKTRHRGQRAGRLLVVAAFSVLCLSCLTISTFSFELRTGQQRAGENEVAHEPTDEPSAGVSRPTEIHAQGENSAKQTLAVSSQQELSSGSAQERAQAACDAGRRHIVAAIPKLVSMLGDDAPIQPLKCWDNGRWSPALETFKRPSPGEQAAIALASMGTPAVEPLAAALSDSSPSVRRNAAWAIGELTNMGESERANAVPSLSSLLSDSDEWVRMAAVRALGEIRDERAVESLMNTLSDASWRVRELGAWALGEMKEEHAVQTLGKLLLEDAQAEVRETAAWALGEIRDPQAAPFLTQALNDAEMRVRDKAKWALSEIEDSDG